MDLLTRAIASRWNLRPLGSVTAMLMVMFAALPATAPAATAEYDLKAVFLYNFPHFVDWPAAAFPAADSPVVLGVLGDDPFGETLDRIVENELVQGRRLVIARFRTVEEIRACHVLFVGGGLARTSAEIVAAIRGRHVLTVGESDRFATEGGIIQFVVREGKIRLKINDERARREGLQISSKLLRQAEIVRQADGS